MTTTEDSEIEARGREMAKCGFMQPEVQTVARDSLAVSVGVLALVIKGA